MSVKEFTIKELLVPLSEYATVPVGATLYDAILALEKTQEEFDHAKYRHRAVLVLDDGGQVVGKLSQLDVLDALEPEMDESREAGLLSRFGFSANLIWAVQREKRPEGSLSEAHLREAACLEVENFMKRPAEGEFVDQEAPLKQAIHQLIVGHHFSLLVTDEKRIVGILRLTDVFAAVFHMMKHTPPGNDEERP
jgi:CBS domain-containing protein